jgi:hypothetical protein
MRSFLLFVKITHQNIFSAISYLWGRRGVSAPYLNIKILDEITVLENLTALVHYTSHIPPNGRMIVNYELERSNRGQFEGDVLDIV